MDKQKHREFRKIVGQILWEEWDPIGVSKLEDWPDDEYASYTGTVCSKLWNNEGKQEILDYLYWAENENMGLDCTKQQADNKNTPLVEKIIAIFSTYKLNDFEQSNVPKP